MKMEKQKQTFIMLHFGRTRYYYFYYIVVARFESGLYFLLVVIHRFMNKPKQISAWIVRVVIWRAVWVFFAI